VRRGCIMGDAQTPSTNPFQIIPSMQPFRAQHPASPHFSHFWCVWNRRKGLGDMSEGGRAFAHCRFRPRRGLQPVKRWSVGMHP
jgi:hypothetical protein